MSERQFPPGYQGSLWAPRPVYPELDDPPAPWEKYEQQLKDRFAWVETLEREIENKWQESS